MFTEYFLIKRWTKNLMYSDSPWLDMRIKPLGLFTDDPKEIDRLLRSSEVHLRRWPETRTVSLWVLWPESWGLDSPLSSDRTIGPSRLLLLSFFCVTNSPWWDSLSVGSCPGHLPRFDYLWTLIYSVCYLRVYRGPGPGPFGKIQGVPYCDIWPFRSEWMLPPVSSSVPTIIETGNSQLWSISYSTDLGHPFLYSSAVTLPPL